MVGLCPILFLWGVWVAASGVRVVSGWIPTNRNSVQFRQPRKSTCKSSSCLYLVSGYGVDGNGDSEGQSLLLSTPRSELEVLLDRMIRYFDSMVDPATNRFYLLSHPQTVADRSQAAWLSAQPKELVSHVHCPLRELGCVWDATKALRVLRCQSDSGTARTGTGVNLHAAILQTVGHYGSLLETDSSGAHLSPTILGEPPTIAHNGLLLLSLLGVWELGWETEMEIPLVSTMDGLARGMVSQQRADGAFRGHFDTTSDDDDVYQDIAFLPGEAMTALLKLYLQSSHRPAAESVPEETRAEILQAAIRALSFYKGYYDTAKEENTMDANYAIWQIQAFSRLVVALRDKDPSQAARVAQQARDYCVDLCQEILGSPAWKQLSRGPSFYPNLSTVEIACGLDALCQGAFVCLDTSLELQPLLRLRMDDAVRFLQWSQDQVPSDVLVGYGGLGYGGYCVTEQRLDVTGHALSALAHLVLPQRQ